MSNSEKNILFAMSAAPFWHCGKTTFKNSIHYFIALLPAAVMSVWHWGLDSLAVMSLSVAIAILTEEFWTMVMKRKSTIDDGTAFISGLLLSFLMPSTAPYWLVIIGSFCAISFGKMVFGGFGANPVNTVLVGWAMIFISFPVFMDPNSMLLNTELVDPLMFYKLFGVEFIDIGKIPTLYEIMIGQQIGPLGASQSLALAIGGIYLIGLGVIRWEISLSFICGVIFISGIYNILYPDAYASPFFHVFTGSTILCAFFLATEFASAPSRTTAMILYGFAGGTLVVIIRTYGIYIDGAPFAVMLINLLSPYFDMIKPKPFGVKK